MAEFLRISENGQSVLLNAGLMSGQSISREQLFEQLAHLGAAHFYVFDKVIESVLNIDGYQADDAFMLEPIVVAERRDASLVVKVDADEMKASITVTSPYGGKPLSAQVLLEALKDNHIIKGLRKAQLHELLLRSKTLSLGQKITLPVAFGCPPKHGKNAYFEKLVEDVASRILTPQETADGKVDMRDLGELITVKPDQPLMRRIPETTGCSGYTICGKVLPAIAGKSIEFKPGKGTYISKHDSNILVASVSGIPVLKPQGMQVDDALVLKGVNVTTGHIDFDGSIIIKGDVAPGMKVTATGNIVVAGFVELAELRAGGDIDIFRGIIGRKQDNNLTACVIESKGSITSKFAQYSAISCGQNAAFSLHALHCEIKAGGDVSVMDKTKRNGVLCGGNIEAGFSVRAVNIGALAGVATTIQAFAKYSEIVESLTLLNKRYENEQLNVTKIKDAQFKLLKMPQHKRPADLVEKIKHSVGQHRDAMNALREQYEQARREYDSLRATVSVTAFKRLYPSIVIGIEKLSMTSTQEQGPSKIHIFHNTLQRDPL